MSSSQSPHQGIAFPLADGVRSTSATGRAVFAAAAGAVDADLAQRIEGASRWHRDYLDVLRALVEVDVRAAGDGDRLPRAGLEALRSRLTIVRDGQEVPLADAFELPSRPPPGHLVIEGQARGRDDPRLSLPYCGHHLEGDALRHRLARWADHGTVEPSLAAAIGRVVDEPAWLDLSGWTFVLLGAGAEMGPLVALSQWGATVVPIDLPVPAVWRRILSAVRDGCGRAIVPVRHRPASENDDDVARAAGVDLTVDFPEIARWLGDLDGPLVVGTYAYADGAHHVRVAMAADAVVQHLLATRDDVSLACLLTPTDVYAVPADVVDDARHRYERAARRRRAARAITRGRLFEPNYLDTITGTDGSRYGIADCLVPQQGPNYALAKRAQRWRLRTARDDGVLVSANVAPATRTRSVVSNRVLAAAYDGAPRYDVEIFEPETSAVLEAALLVRDLRDPDAAANPKVPLDHPLGLFADTAAHGGLWRQPFAPRTVLPVAAMRGLLPPRPSRRSR